MQQLSRLIKVIENPLLALAIIGIAGNGYQLYLFALGKSSQSLPEVLLYLTCSLVGYPTVKYAEPLSQWLKGEDSDKPGRLL